MTESQKFDVLTAIIKTKKRKKSNKLKGDVDMSVVTITSNNFEEEVIKSQVPVLIDFWASWCGPCRMLSPVIEEIAGEVTDKKICKVNVDEQPELARRFGVMSIPTLVVMKNGELFKKSLGVQPKSSVMSMFNA